MRMNTVAIIGLGSIGVYFAPRMEQHLGNGNFCVIADGKRKERLESQGVTVNGENYRFPVCAPKDGKETDLIIMAVKDMALTQAISDIKRFIGKNTQILCVMNGVVSEEKVAAVYGWEHVLYSYIRVSIALKDGKADFNPNGGKVYFGEAHNKILTERVLAVKDLMERCDIPYGIQEDMIRGIWYKFMTNIGENMTCALLGIPYGAFRKSTYANEIRLAAMKEVQAIAQKKEIVLTDEDMENQSRAIMNIPFHNRPSTLQDLENHKKTEVEMFAGTVVDMGKELGVPTPVSWMFYHGIKVHEEKNAGLLCTGIGDIK